MKIMILVDDLCYQYIAEKGLPILSDPEGRGYLIADVAEGDEDRSGYHFDNYSYFIFKEMFTNCNDADRYQIYKVMDNFIAEEKEVLYQMLNDLGAESNFSIFRKEDARSKYDEIRGMEKFRDKFIKLTDKPF